MHFMFCDTAFPPDPQGKNDYRTTLCCRGIKIKQQHIEISKHRIYETILELQLIDI